MLTGCAQEELHLSTQQQQQVLEVRKGILLWLQKAAEARTQAYGQLGRELVLLSPVYTRIAA